MGSHPQALAALARFCGPRKCPAGAEAELRRDLREEVQVLYDHLCTRGVERAKAVDLVERLAALPRPTGMEIRDQEPLPERPRL